MSASITWWSPSVLIFEKIAPPVAQNFCASAGVGSSSRNAKCHPPMVLFHLQLQGMAQGWRGHYGSEMIDQALVETRLGLRATSIETRQGRDCVCPYHQLEAPEPLRPMLKQGPAGRRGPDSELRHC